VVFTLPHLKPCFPLFTCRVCYRIKCLVIILGPMIHVSKIIRCVVMSPVPPGEPRSAVNSVFASLRKSFLAPPFKYGELKTLTVFEKPRE
jgi:hypothetical protein